jgi:regulatory protein
VIPPADPGARPFGTHRGTSTERHESDADVERTAAAVGVGPSPRVTRLEPLNRSGLRVRLALDDGTSLEAATEAVERTGLGAGDPLDDELRARLLDGDLLWRVREAAMEFLARRPYGRQELRRRLLRRSFPADTVDACLSSLEAQRLVDDGAFARSFVRDRLRLRPRGKRRLAQEMREKGLAPATIEDAVAEVFADEQVAEDGLASQAALAWVRRQRPDAREALAARDRSPERERAVRRLSGFLARRGFTGDVVRAAVAAAVDAARAPAQLNGP